jgi:hypothetical protein
MTCPTLCLSVLGQALIQHDLRAHSWPDFAELSRPFGTMVEPTGEIAVARAG